MKNFKIGNAIKIAFSSFLIFILCFIWTSYYTKKIWLSSIISIFFAIFIEFFIYFVSKLKNKHKKQQVDISAYFNTLIMNGHNFCVNFFYEMLNKKYETKKKNKCLQINSTIIYPQFTFRKFSVDDYLNIIHQFPQNNVLILTNEIDKSVYEYIKNFNHKTRILNAPQIYKLFFEKYRTFPPKTQMANNKASIKEILSLALNKKRTKAYFCISLLLLFYSFFTPFKLYYAIMSSLLLILSYFSFNNVKFNITQADSLEF